jgi:hypothetical protein
MYLENFGNLARKNNEGVKGTKGFLLKKMGPSCHFMREFFLKKKLKSPY